MNKKDIRENRGRNMNQLAKEIRIRCQQMVSVGLLNPEDIEEVMEDFVKECAATRTAFRVLDMLLYFDLVTDEQITEYCEKAKMRESGQ